MRPLPVEVIAGSPRPVLGFAIIRGRPMPVVDLGWALAAEPSRPSRFVTIDVAGRHVALAVDAVVGVRAIPNDALDDLPPLLAEADASVVAAVGTLDEQLLVVLRSARLVPDEVWRQLADRGAAG
jgi:purine-binding chemotaxis protein CheW